MSRTFINQSTQIGGSEQYDDALTPGSSLANQETLQGDLNALRTILKQVVNPQGNWYDQPTASLEQLNTSVSGQGTDIAALQASVATVEGDVATINTTLATQAGEIDAVEASIATIQTQVATAEGNISSLTTNLAATDLNVSTLQGDVLIAQSNITTLQTGLSSAEGSIADLEGTLGTAEGNIATLQLDVSNLTQEQSNLGITVAGLVTGLSTTDANVSGLDARLGIAEGDIDTLQSDLVTTNLAVGVLQSSMSVAETDIDALQLSLSTAEGTISTLQSGLSTAQGDITSLQGDVSTLQSTVSTHGTDISTLQSNVSTAQGDITALQSASNSQGSAITTLQGDVSTLQSDVAGKVSKSGDAMVGGLSITPANLGSALGLTTVGTALTIADAVDGQFFEINTSLQQMTFSDPLGSGNVAVVDPAEVVVSTNDGQGNNLARTNVMSGVIELVQNGSPAVPTLDEHVVNKAYADQKLALGGGTMSGAISLGGNGITDLATPSSALDAATKGYVDAVAMGLKIKAPVEAKYDFAGGLAPDVPTLPSQPSGVLYPGTVYTVITEAQLDAAITAAVDGDSIWVPMNTTITLTSSKTINKSIRIFGKADNTSVFTASFAVAANSGLFIVAGKKANGAQNNNVQFDGLVFTSSSNQSDHACIVANTLSAEFPNGSTGLRIDSCTFNHTEFGLTVAADSWTVSNCTFNYIPESGASDTHRHMGVYNIGTIGWVEGCDFRATTEATPRTIAMLLTASDYIFTPGATASGGFSGDLVVKNCTQSSGNMRQWFVQEVFKANGLNSAPMPTYGFSLWFSGNTVGQTSSGTIIAYEGSGTKAPLSFYDAVYLSGNSFGDSSGTKKGAVAVDGLGAKRSAGAPMTIYAENNSGTVFTTALSGTYVQGAATTNMVAVNSTYFDTPSPLLAVETPSVGGPLLPSGEGVVVGSYTAQPGDRIFVENAYNSLLSGIYICSAGDWAYADDWTGDVASSFFFVKQGDYADTSWVEVSDPALVGQSSMTFAQFSGPGTYTGTGAIDVSAQNVISVVNGGITNDMLAGSIALSKLASTVYTQSETDDLLSDKLDLAGGTMSASSSIIFASDSGTISGLADLTPNSLDSSAANKKYVDEAVAGIDARTSKTYSVVTAQNGVIAGIDLYSGMGGNLDVALPSMPLDPADLSSKFDIYLNGQLLRVGQFMDVERSPNNPKGLVMSYNVVLGDTFCVIEYA